MNKKIISLLMIVPLVFGSGLLSAAAQETDSITVSADEVSVEEETQYVNGIEADYEDPDCIKYLENQEASSDEASDDAVMRLSSSSYNYTTSWGGTTYYHRDDLAADVDVSAGIDVSKWQADIDWTKVKAAGVEFAFIRLGYRSTSSSGTLNMDSYYTKNMKNATAAGVKVGVYFFSQAITVAEAKAEANYVLSNLGGYDPDLPIMIDYEYAGGRLTSSLSNATKTAILNAFCKVIEDAGYEAGIYSNTSMLTSDLNAGDIGADYDIWLAQWNTKASYTGTYSFWQCTSSASVNGISGNVDLDWRYDTDDDAGGRVVHDSATNQWVYQNEDGEIDYSYTGFARNSNGWWYLEDGIVTFNKNSVIKGTVKGTSAWWYVVGSKVQTSFTGLADYPNENGWFYITNGHVDFGVNTVAKNKNGWYYVTGGKVQFDFTGLADYPNANGWWYIKGGKVDFTYTGFSKNKNGWWYIENGGVTFKKNSVIQGKVNGTSAWWYVVGSKVQTSFTGLANYANQNGWFYITNGKADFSVNTVAKNKNGWYYVTGGKVQFGYTGVADYPNANGWWYIQNGHVNFNYNGIGKNKNGWWYIRSGKVIFSYTGYVTVSGVKYSVVNGKVNR